MILEFTFDAASAQARFDALANNLSGGFGATVKTLGQKAGQSIQTNIERGGRPDPFAHLSASSIAHREELLRRGKVTSLPASLDTPLRLTDRLFKAASASAPGVKGSRVRQTAWEWSNTLTLDYAGRQDAQREFFFFQDSDVDDAADTVLADVNARIDRAGA